MASQWRAGVSFLVVTCAILAAGAVPVPSDDVMPAADDTAPESQLDFSDGKKAMTLKKDTGGRLSPRNQQIGGATESNMSLKNARSNDLDLENGPSDYDPEFVDLVRALVYRIELMAEEKYLKDELQSIIDSVNPVENSVVRAIPAEETGPHVAKLQDGDVRPVKVGEDKMASVEANVRPIDEEEAGDTLLNQLSSLPHRESPDKDSN